MCASVQKLRRMRKMMIAMSDWPQSSLPPSGAMKFDRFKTRFSHRKPGV